MQTKKYHSPKSRVLIVAKWHKPEMAKNRGEPQEMTYIIARKRNFFQGGPNGKVVALGCTSDMPCWQKLLFQNKKLNFGPKFPNFWVKIAHFRPRRPIGASPVNVFNTKEVSYWFPPPKKWMFGPFDPMPNQKTMQTRCLGGFSVMCVPKLLLPPKKI